MRTILCSLFISALALGAANAQDLKVGIVDMTKVFQDYYKTKDAETLFQYFRRNGYYQCRVGPFGVSP